ncbi:antibiotic biosynthesis monooxygenase [Nonomuraea sp. NPDC046802]|uniref:antibiotic biosynthesis monooxygenase n=1 Tax=Nonomuraea sp. NPDC046802 TaxID=3154919 RepID=UPI0033CCC512
MIARTWRGRVPARHADAFERHLLATGVADCSALAGYLGAEVARADIDGHVEFRLITYWQSWEAISAFAGPDLGTAVLYPGDERYELVPDRSVEHHHITYRRLTALTEKEQEWK